MPGSNLKLINSMRKRQTAIYFRVILHTTAQQASNIATEKFSTSIHGNKERKKLNEAVGSKGVIEWMANSDQTKNAMKETVHRVIIETFLPSDIVENSIGNSRLGHFKQKEKGR